MFGKFEKYEGIKLICFSRETFVGWGGRIRTYGTRDQNPMPYHLATPQLHNELHYLKIIFKHFRRAYSIQIIISFPSIPYKVFLFKNLTYIGNII